MERVWLASYPSRLVMGTLRWTAHSPIARTLPDMRTSSFTDTSGTHTSNNARCTIASSVTVVTGSQFSIVECSWIWFSSGCRVCGVNTAVALKKLVRCRRASHKFNYDVTIDIVSSPYHTWSGNEKRPHSRVACSTGTQWEAVEGE